MKMKFFSLLLNIFGLSIFVQNSLAGDTNLMRTTVPVSIEGKYQSSSLVAVFPMRKMDYELVKFKPGNKSELAIKTLLDGIRSNNVEMVFPLFKGSEDYGNMEKLKELVGAYRNMFPLEQARIIGDVLIGNSHMFVWQVENNGKQWTRDKLVRRQFTIIETNGNSACEYVSEPVGAFVLNDILQQIPNHPERFSPVASHPLKYSVAVSTGQDPVRIEFDGLVCDADLSAPESSLTNNILKFYLNSYQILTNTSIKTFNTFLERLDPATRERIRANFEESPKSDLQFRQMEQDASSRRVRFILNADPVYIVFFENFGVLRHEYVISNGNGFMLANLGAEGFLDRVLDLPKFTDVIESLK